MVGDYISREAVLAQKGDCYDKDGHLLYAVGTGNILRIPAADVVEVVRCKDCRRSFRDPRGERYCNHLVSRWNPAEAPRYVNDYDYCSWGVR